MEMGPHGYPLRFSYATQTSTNFFIARQKDAPLSKDEQTPGKSSGGARASCDIAHDVEAHPPRDYEEQGPTIDRGSYQPPQTPEAAYEGARPVSYQVCFLFDIVASLLFAWGHAWD